MSKVFEKKGLTKKSENISEWYHDVVIQAGLAEYSDVKGCMIIKPHGYAIWEKVQMTLDVWFKKDGVQNAYFPLFIPMSLIKKEAEHVEGFAPELAVVTHGGGEELEEPLVIRPTSETIINQSFANWIQSYRDLPMKINQWANVVRWEKRTYPFLRTTEFLWQEGHTAHADEADAMEMTMRALEWYKKFYGEVFAISPYIGLKSRNETFAGAEKTFSIEIVLPDGKALQGATSHYLADHFAKVFNVTYLNEKSEAVHVKQTSWGLSTRAIGGLVLVHGDDSGLVLPPLSSPIQIVVLPIGGKVDDNAQIQSEAATISDELKNSGFRVLLDTNFQHSLGYRINESELKGIPLRLEFGKKELENKTLTLVRRDTFEKRSIPQDNAVSVISEIIETMQKDLFNKSKKLKEDLTFEASNFDEFKSILSDKKAFIRAFWCEDSECEKKIKEETKATTRVLELDRIDENEDGMCVHCGKSARRKWLFAQSY